MGELSRPDDGPPEFGTEAFYASIGRAFVVMCAVVPVLFLIELINWTTEHGLAASAGIVPRRLHGIDGIVFAPFLHASFLHVIANSVPLILLGTLVLGAGVRRTLWSTGLIILVAGVGVWTLGDVFFEEGPAGGTSVHVGASGVVFGYLGLLLTRAIVERSWWSAGVAVLVGALFGWQLQSAVPGQDGISWEGHLFGFIGGVIAAIVFRRRRPRQTLDSTTPLNLPDFKLPR